MKNTLDALRLLEWIRNRYENKRYPVTWAMDISRKVAVKKHLSREAVDYLDFLIGRHQGEANASDWGFRVCQAVIAGAAGFKSRNQWMALLNNTFKEAA